MDVNDLESQIHGPFNAIVSTYGRVAWRTSRIVNEF
jgi:hypothetical protein